MPAFLWYPLSFLAAFLLATWVIRRVMPMLDANARDPEVRDRPSIFMIQTCGFWIGFAEMILYFIFVVEGEYGALAIVVGAKEFVRKEKIAENAAYYLLGTLVNLAIALLFARWVIWMAS